MVSNWILSNRMGSKQSIRNRIESNRVGRMVFYKQQVSRLTLDSWSDYRTMYFRVSVFQYRFHWPHTPRLHAWSQDSACSQNVTWGRGNSAWGVHRIETTRNVENFFLLFKDGTERVALTSCPRRWRNVVRKPATRKLLLGVWRRSEEALMVRSLFSWDQQKSPDFFPEFVEIFIFYKLGLELRL